MPRKMQSRQMSNREDQREFCVSSAGRVVRLLELKAPFSSIRTEIRILEGRVSALEDMEKEDA